MRSKQTKYTIYSMRSDLIVKKPIKCKAYIYISLTKNEIYERLNEKIMSMHNSNAFLEHYEIHKNTIDKRSDRGSF